MTVAIPKSPADGVQIVFWQILDDAIEQFRVTYHRDRSHAWVTGDRDGKPWVCEWCIEQRYIDFKTSEWRIRGRNSTSGLIEHVRSGTADGRLFATFIEARDKLVDNFGKRIHMRRQQVEIMEHRRSFYQRALEPGEE